jgi:hypothetical protein
MRTQTTWCGASPVLGVQTGWRPYPETHGAEIGDAINCDLSSRRRSGRCLVCRLQVSIGGSLDGDIL